MSTNDQFRVKAAEPYEMNQVYMMGYEVWSKGLEPSEYLKFCIGNEKLNSGQWLVLEGPEGLLSSLALYQFSDRVFGFGSIATEARHRGKGYARQLIQDLLAKMDSQRGNKIIFLYSDIGPSYYQQFDFTPLPESLQRHAGSVCMARGCEDISGLLPHLIPDYF